MDVDRERDRVQVELRDVQERVRIVSSKLANDGFITKAPPEVINAEKIKAEQLEREVASLEEQLSELS